MRVLKSLFPYSSPLFLIRLFHKLSIIFWALWITQCIRKIVKTSKDIATECKENNSTKEHRGPERVLRRGMTGEWKRSRKTAVGRGQGTR